MTDRVARGLTAFVDAWIDWASTATLADVKALGPPPWASLANGAAGNAYALWSIGRIRRDRQLVVAARRWWLAARRAAVQPRGLRAGQLAGTSVAGSVAFGLPGIHAVGGLVADAQGHTRERDRAIDALAASLPRRLRAEWMTGAAGALTAALALHRRTGAPRARELADRLAQRLLASGPRWERGAAFAHGNAGVQHALISWARATGADARGVVAGIAPPSIERVVAAAPRGLAGSWCNGLAGFVLLWARAFEASGDERWLAAARAGVAELEREREPSSGGLCCGVGGYAYAALALHRIEPEAGWLERARALAARALTDESLGNGLQSGLAGLAWLAGQLR